MGNLKVGSKIAGIDVETVGGSASKIAAALVNTALTGIPTAPTAAVDTATTQIATNAFVINQGYEKRSLGTISDFNAALTHGHYLFTGSAVNGAVPGNYGVLEVILNDGGTHDNANNWIWQHYLDTAGRSYMRYKVNAGAWIGWTEQIDATIRGTITPLMDGVAAVGTSNKLAREDHTHATDTSRAPLDSPALTGSPTAPTPVGGTNNNQLATTAFVEAVRVALYNSDVLKAPIASPTFTGIATSPLFKSAGNRGQVSIAPGALIATLTHNLGTTNYTVSYGANSPARHVGWSNKLANSIDFSIETAYDQTILVDITLMPY